MPLVGDIVQKTGELNLLTIEAEKASRAFEIGRGSGLFTVPRAVNVDAEACALEFERLNDLVTLLDLAVRKDRRLPGLLKKTGQALSVIHEKLVLPEKMKHELPPEWMGPAGENVFIHGDFACINVCFHETSNELVLLDWSAAPSVGRIPTFGSRHFDILLFISSIFHGAPWRRVLSWNAKEMAETFLRGYKETTTLNAFKDYAPQICQLQRKNVRRLAAQRQFSRAAGFICHQMLMNARLRLFLHECEQES